MRALFPGETRPKGEWTIRARLGSESRMGQATGRFGGLRLACKPEDKLESETLQRSLEELTRQDGAKQIDGGPYSAVAE